MQNYSEWRVFKQIRRTILRDRMKQSASASALMAQPRRTFARKADRGFAIIAAVMLVPVLMLLAVGLLGMSSISLRRSTTQMAMDEARANARLALQLAIGELQQHMGPDQRISADGRLLNDANPHWVSVWRSTREDGSSYIVRDNENGGLKDLRGTGWNARSERIATLVSGNEGEQRFQGDSSVNGSERVELVSEAGNAGDMATSTLVEVPKVELEEGGKTKGSYAWWVGDLGIKANVATRDASERTKTAYPWRSLQLAQDASWSAAVGGRELEEESRKKAISLGQLDLASNGAKSSKTGFHDFTTESKGLLTDVRAGGWRKDLTAFIESSGSIGSLDYDGVPSVGVSDADNLVGPRNREASRLATATATAPRHDLGSPNFGLLRDWAKRSATTSPGNFKTAMEMPTLTKANSGSVEFNNRTKNDLMPTLVEGSIYYNLSYYEDKATNPTAQYGLRLHLYPRVALWNPYQFEIEVPNSMIMMHINGSKRVEVTMQDGNKQGYQMYWGQGGGEKGGAVQGRIYFRMMGTKLAPGETLVWSPRQSRRYDEVTFSNNIMYPDVAPNPAVSFYQDTRTADAWPLFKANNEAKDSKVFNNRIHLPPVEWREYVPDKPIGDLQDLGYLQSDDYFMLWKPMTGGSSVNLDGFNALPQGSLVSCAYQFGDDDELPVEWSYLDPVPFPRSTKTNAAINQVPDRRTRDGFRMRWFNEHDSNVMGSGSLAGTPHFQCAPIATWNMRATYALRNPFDNVTDVAPHFFGIYTRDLFDGEVDWNNMMPQLSSGKYLGDPFDRANSFRHPRVLFDLPRKDTAIASLGAFQHAKLSEFIWHPTYPLGNSLADPRIGREYTEPIRSEKMNRDRGGWNQDTLGYSMDGRSDPDGAIGVSIEDSWAHLARKMLRDAPLDQTLIYDLSYEVNDSLWDEFFLSTGSPADKESFLRDPDQNPLPNGRLLPNPAVGEIETSDLTNYHLAASKLMLDGAFNVNSASAKAWEALLLSGAGGIYGDKVAFPRIYGLTGGEWDGGGASDKEAWSGQRLFTRDEIRKLSEAIVLEVKTRGPFLSLSDFVNRRLRDDETGNKGALQAAIDRAELNRAFEQRWPLDRTDLPDYAHVDHIKDPTRLEQRFKPDTVAWGAPGFLTQADLLQFIGPVLTARSDSFVIRAYGSAPSTDGGAPVEAWCEAVVQRTPVPLNGDSLGLNPKPDQGSPDLGRKFQVASFRWLKREEI
ncbi:hypothetical protein OKA04_22735 [Luteolibacter flavescens]|uniref:Verru_Chthon cassette protein A n=1 Tax=Luteolibacter flavescens TaxID=1859460 RepID=A0ABT3FWF2_9BACT|nr:hypothetical protein [Luteolibacter flavescens]MCW1887571.1 hypothetical protein [Luteolibacter flavescens]